MIRIQRLSSLMELKSLIPWNQSYSHPLIRNEWLQLFVVGCLTRKCQMVDTLLGFLINQTYRKGHERRSGGQCDRARPRLKTSVQYLDPKTRAEVTPVEGKQQPPFSASRPTASASNPGKDGSLHYGRRTCPSSPKLDDLR